MSTPLPDDPRDGRLAGLLGEQRAAGRPLAEASPDDPLWEVLLAYRQSVRPEPVADDVSERIWAGIERSTRRQPDRPPQRRMHMYRLPTWGRRALAVAAALVVLVGALWLLVGGPEAELVAVAEASSVEYVTDDGSLITLRPHSQLYRREAGRYRLDGEAYFAVVAQRAGRTFSVIGGEGRVTVLGTRFNMATWGARTKVYLDEGLVRLTHRGTQAAAVMEAGQQGVVTENGVEVKYATDVRALDWLRGELAFETERVREVLDEIEQHFAVRIEVPQDLAAERITGRILLDDRKQALSDLGTVLGGRFVEMDGVYRFEE